jgi:hypothetical protein
MSLNGKNLGKAAPLLTNCSKVYQNHFNFSTLFAVKHSFPIGSKINNFKFFEIYGHKKGKTPNLFFPLLVLLLFDRDPRWNNIRIRDNLPGSATLIMTDEK